MSYIQTHDYSVDRARGTGTLLLCNKHTGRWMLFQGIDAEILEQELAHVPVRLMDTVLSQYEGSLK